MFYKLRTNCGANKERIRTVNSDHVIEIIDGRDYRIVILSNGIELVVKNSYSSLVNLSDDSLENAAKNSIFNKKTTEELQEDLERMDEEYHE